MKSLKIFVPWGYMTLNWLSDMSPQIMSAVKRYQRQEKDSAQVGMAEGFELKVERWEEDPDSLPKSEPAMVALGQHPDQMRAEILNWVAKERGHLFFMHDRVLKSDGTMNEMKKEDVEAAVFHFLFSNNFLARNPMV